MPRRNGRNSIQTWASNSHAHRSLLQLIKISLRSRERERERASSLVKRWTCVRSVTGVTASHAQLYQAREPARRLNPRKTQETGPVPCHARVSVAAAAAAATAVVLDAVSAGGIARRQCRFSRSVPRQRFFKIGERGWRAASLTASPHAALPMPSTGSISSKDACCFY